MLVKADPDYMARDWPRLQRGLLHNYTQQNTRQQMNTKNYLIELAAKYRSGKENLKGFYTQFDAVARNLMKN